ncbi:ABC transporter ATP-binding protein [Burkholderiaceae bacterium DAT-1]|nr:ABC transporter ATP-binding protein [Burkholderiaceae bacterium DAT-1]
MSDTLNDIQNRPVILSGEHLYRVLPGEVETTLVNDVSVEMRAGEFVCIMGPSGSGKSSLLYLLGLLDPPTSGRIIVDGVDTSRFNDSQLTELRLAKLGYVFQFHFLLAEFTCLQNVLLPMQKLGKLGNDAMQTRALALLDDLGLKGHANKLPHQISGGQRQRVAIARALANDPPLILADEPTGNLDTSSSQNVRQILRELCDSRHKTIVAVTHERAFSAAADRIVNIVDGKVSESWQA